MTEEKQLTKEQQDILDQFNAAKKQLTDAGITIDNNEQKPEEEENIHVEIIGDSILADGRIKIEMDWNDSFIKTLRNSGYTGANDERIIQQWLIHVYEGIITDLDNGDTHEYE